ncbi:MAG: hypothetical protein ABSE41_03325 [Bacteroidota bacterium]|jgi:hypothetical protein
MNHLPTTYTILRRTDSKEYLSHFEFWDLNSINWSANVDEAFLFKTHSDAEINGRMVLEWLGDPLNRHVCLRQAGTKITGSEMTVGQWCSINITRAA